MPGNLQEGRVRINNHDVGFMSLSVQKKLWRNISLTVLASCANVEEQG
jgi:hypothetical protein